ncbi:hypothetical protein MKW92_041734 [Papaver armeniacum]|nr:hypothetical protein MKW92_041734 [Papaver armeniacum]
MNPRFFRSIVKRPICTRYQSGNGGYGGGDGGGSGLGGVVDDGGSKSLFSSQLPGGYVIVPLKA